MKTYRFKKDEVCHLDEVYNLLGVIPNDSYVQDDQADVTRFNSMDDEIVRFKKNVTVKIEVKVT